MSALNSVNTWDYNCGPQGGNPIDLDYRAVWGDDGTLTIQRNQLRSISYSMRCWNSLDGWIQVSDQQSLPVPTSQPHTFGGVKFYYAFARNNVGLYWTRRYIIEATIVVVYGPNQHIVDEEVITTVNGCFTKNDPNYIEIYPGCIPPDEGCEP
jgi:hypothetical protein